MKLIKSDYFVIVAFVMFIGAHTTTNFLIKYYENVAVAVGEMKEVAHIIESNPIMQLMYQFNNLRFLFQFVMLPSLLFGTYYYARKRYLGTNPELLESLAASIMMIGFIDASNDISIMLGILAK